MFAYTQRNTSLLCYISSKLGDACLFFFTLNPSSAATSLLRPRLDVVALGITATATAAAASLRLDVSTLHPRVLPTFVLWLEIERSLLVK